MKYVWHLKTWWRRAVYRLVCLLVVAVLAISWFGPSAARADSFGAAPAWAQPAAMALQRVGAADSDQPQDGLLNNVDCTRLTYRLTGTAVMREGCFTPTAFGLLDSKNAAAIFNGTDEAVPLVPYGQQQVLAPWPKALNLLTLDSLATGGSMVNMYKNPLGSLRDQRDSAGLLSKKLIAPPEMALTDEAGRRLTVNPQTISFSSDGGWMVAETIYGSFVRISLSSLEVLPFAPAFNNLNGAMPLDAQVAVSPDGRYVAIASGQVASFKVYDLTACTGQGTDWRTNSCPAHEYWPFVGQRISGLRSVVGLHFINDGLLSFNTTPADPAGSSLYELAPTATITALTDYIGLGDSYTSGEGAFDYLAGTDTTDNHCHLSAYSYPLLLTRDLFTAGGGHSVACSGAVIADIGSSSGAYRGQARAAASFDTLRRDSADQLAGIMADYTPGYVAQQRFVQTYQPRVTTVSIGGNDIGFGDILQNCVAPHLSPRPDGQTCYDSYESRLELANLIDRTVPRWTALYKQLRVEAPQTRLYAIGYPSVAVTDGSCALNVRLDRQELAFAETLLAYLNGAIRRAADEAGVPFVDVSQALVGHRLCEASGNAVAVNGLTAGKDSLGLLGRESYHPNMLGQQLLEEAILRGSHNLSDAYSNGPIAGSDSRQLLEAPRTGQTVHTLTPDNTVVSPVVSLSAATPLYIDGLRDGLKPNTAYTAHLDGPGNPIAATFFSDDTGDLSGTLPLPADTTSGGHRLDIIGPNQSGGLLDVSQSIYVTDGAVPADEGAAAVSASNIGPPSPNFGASNTPGVSTVSPQVATKPAGLAPVKRLRLARRVLGTSHFAPRKLSRGFTHPRVARATLTALHKHRRNGLNTYYVWLMGLALVILLVIRQRRL